MPHCVPPFCCCVVPGCSQSAHFHVALAASCTFNLPLQMPRLLWSNPRSRMHVFVFPMQHLAGRASTLARLPDPALAYMAVGVPIFCTVPTCMRPGRPQQVARPAPRGRRRRASGSGGDPCATLPALQGGAALLSARSARGWSAMENVLLHTLQLDDQPMVRVGWAHQFSACMHDADPLCPPPAPGRTWTSTPPRACSPRASSTATWCCTASARRTAISGTK